MAAFASRRWRFEMVFPTSLPDFEARWPFYSRTTAMEVVQEEVQHQWGKKKREESERKTKAKKFFWLIWLIVSRFLCDIKHTKRVFHTIEFRPNQFSSFLEEIGFSLVQCLQPEKKQKGFDRPMWVYTKPRVES